MTPSILAITPPSRPMGLTLDYYVETENITHPMITWNHNKEPDMLRADTRKKYRIWRATYTNMNYVPVGYLLIDSVLIDSGTVPTYIDTTIYGMGTYWAGFGDQVQYPVRYLVEWLTSMKTGRQCLTCIRHLGALRQLTLIFYRSGQPGKRKQCS